MRALLAVVTGSPQDARTKLSLGLRETRCLPGSVRQESRGADPLGEQTSVAAALSEAGQTAEWEFDR